MEDKLSTATSSGGPVSPRPSIDIDKFVASGRPSPIRTDHARPISPGCPTVPILLRDSEFTYSGPRTAVSRDSSFDGDFHLTTIQRPIMSGTFIAFSLDPTGIASLYDESSPGHAEALALQPGRYLGLVSDSFICRSAEPLMQELIVHFVGTAPPPCPEAASPYAIPISPCPAVEGMRPPLNTSGDLFPYQDCMVWTALGVRLFIEIAEESALHFELPKDDRTRFETDSYADRMHLWERMSQPNRDPALNWDLTNELSIPDQHLSVPTTVWRDVRIADTECRRDPAQWTREMMALEALYQKYPLPSESPIE
ncbi:hypothetical protein OBBRIDRAFT_515677 [Obba rivulosa]|uniref:Uncharacterized protein n=1 Tax=Obba rivulosa TaxID=1052685 RepID=A0A8E2DKL4_9APHY|nr:hypothetical protein OBBRIDRAFT_515677 [Obba rivulosa]